MKLHNIKSIHSVNKQRGLSIVELMVALVLSLVVMFITTSIYVSNKQTYRFLDQYSLLQENGRFAIFFLRENILQAGYPRQSSVDPFPNAPANDNTVRVQFRAAVDCINAAGTGTPPTVENVFTISANQELICNGQPLVEGIEAMRVEYGIDIDDDGIANSYVLKDQVTAGVGPGGASWNEVVSVRVAVLVAGQPNSLDVAQSITYNMLGNAVTPTADRTPRRVFTTTIPLRNRNKTII